MSLCQPDSKSAASQEGDLLEKSTSLRLQGMAPHSEKREHAGAERIQDCWPNQRQTCHGWCEIEMATATVANGRFLFSGRERPTGEERSTRGTWMICPLTFCPCTIQPRTVHPYFFTSPYVSSLKFKVHLVPEMTHCHGNFVLHYVPEFINCTNFWSLFFPFMF